MKQRMNIRASIAMFVVSVFAFTGLFGAYSMRAQAEPEALRARSNLTWKKCGDAIEGYPNSELSCTTIRVPLDYNKPNGKKISVAVSRVQAANPQTKRGVLFLNPGGPGGPGLDLPQLFTILMPPEVRAQYDLVGFDPRGVGQSTPVSCGLSAADASQAMVPQAKLEGFAATSAFMQKVAKSCAETSGGSMPYMTTNNTARDMDHIRQALGVKKISYLGYSYGTYLGSVYASMYPNRTDRFILDSAVGGNWIWREQFRNWRSADRERFPDFAKYLAANDGAFQLGTTEAAIGDVFDKLVKRLNDKPLVFDDGTTFNGEQFRLFTFSVLYNDGYFPEGGAIWQYLNELPDETMTPVNVREGVTRILGKSSAQAQGPVDNNAASALAVLCDDTTWSRAPAQYQAELRADTLMNPRFGSVGSQIWPCAFWQTNAKESLTTLSSQGPRNILILQNLRDPATPYIGAQDMRDRLGRRAQFVTVDQGGHGAAYMSGNQCASDAASSYLTTGTLSATDTVCESEATTNLRARTADTGVKAEALETLRQRIR